VAVLVLVGTRKGLFTLRGDDSRTSWEVDGPLLKGWEVFHATLDPRDGSLYAAANHFVYGATVQRSNDLGRTWERSEQLAMPDGHDPLKRMWHVEPGHASQPDALWAGGDPGVLFRSDDGGSTWEANSGLLEHPTRERWQPGAGGMCLHSIQLDPSDADRLYVAISAAGAFRTDDGGETWTPANKGVAADFMEDDKFPEVGQCVHKLLLPPANPDRLWQQNHCGVYRSDDRGETWERLEANGLPSGFGFPIALEPSNPDVAYVVPEEGAENRVTSDGRLGVYRTGDGGKTWSLHADGLPDRAWVAVLREGMAYDDGGVYLGAQSGSVFALSTGDGSWTEAASQLPPVLSVEAAAWPGS
jgi:photosystem II stability/assembly factor-like uncharacterized protein